MNVVGDTQNEACRIEGAVSSFHAALPTASQPRQFTGLQIATIPQSSHHACNTRSTDFFRELRRVRMARSGSPILLPPPRLWNREF